MKREQRISGLGQLVARQLEVKVVRRGLVESMVEWWGKVGGFTRENWEQGPFASPPKKWWMKGELDGDDGGDYS